MVSYSGMFSEIERGPANSPGSGLRKKPTRKSKKEQQVNDMVTLAVNGMLIITAVALVGIAIQKWHILRDRRRIFSAIHCALKNRSALWSGICMAVFYIAVFLFMGGKGGRIHLLFGRLIWNTTPGEILTGLLLAILVMISTALFVFGIGVMGAKQSGRKSGMGFFGSLLAILAAFCP